MTETFNVAVRVSKAQFRVFISEAPDGPISRVRDGGKPAASKLLKVCKPTSKRANFLRWFLEAEDGEGRTIGAAMTNFSLPRHAVLSYWYFIHREHGIGYTLTNNTITPRLPPKCDPSKVFGV